MEQDIEPIRKQAEFKAEIDIACGVVIIVIYEVTDGEKHEVTRGLGHIIHEGVVGIAQACSYASKRAFMDIDNGVYFKQNRNNNIEKEN